MKKREKKWIKMLGRLGERAKRWTHRRRSEMIKRAKKGGSRNWFGQSQFRLRVDRHWPLSRLTQAPTYENLIKIFRVQVSLSGCRVAFDFQEAERTLWRANRLGRLLETRALPINYLLRNLQTRNLMSWTLENHLQEATSSSSKADEGKEGRRGKTIQTQTHHESITRENCT